MRSMVGEPHQKIANSQLVGLATLDPPYSPASLSFSIPLRPCGSAPWRGILSAFRLTVAYTFLARQVFPEERRVAVVLLIFTIGVVNICLGYKLAVFLGFGPPSLSEGWDALAGLPSVGATAVIEEPAVPQAPATPAAASDQSPAPTEGASPAEADAPPAAEAAWQLDETFVESNILKFNLAIARSGDKCEGSRRGCGPGKNPGTRP